MCNQSMQDILPYYICVPCFETKIATVDAHYRGILTAVPLEGANQTWASDLSYGEAGFQNATWDKGWEREVKIRHLLHSAHPSET